MATTLSDINATLQDQNKTLESQAEKTESLNSNISFLVKQIQAQRLDDREKEIESKSDAKRETDTARGRARAASSSRSSGLAIPGAGLIAGGLGAIGGLVGSATTLLMNVPVLGGLLTKLISFGSLFLRTAPFMLAAYVIIENIDSIVKIFDNITNSKIFQALLSTAEDLLRVVFDFENWSDLFTAFTQKIREGFTGLVKLTEGDIGGAFDNIAGIGTLLGTLFLMFGKTRAILANLVKSGASLLADFAGKAAKLGGAAVAAGAATAAAAVTSAAPTLKPEVKPTLPPNVVFDSASNRYRNTETGKFVKAPEASGGLSKAMQRFPKLFKVLDFLKSVPGLGKALAVAPLLTALATGAGPDKIAPLAGSIIGGALGWKAGGILGGLLGAAGGPAALVTGLGGAALGGLLGDSLGTSIAQWATGQKASGMPFGFGWIDDLLNGDKGKMSPASGSGTPQPVGPVPTVVGSQATQQQPVMTKQAPQTAPAVASLAAQNAASSGKQVVIVQGGSSQSITNVSNNSQGLLMPAIVPFDRADPFFLSRGTSY